MNQEQRHQLGLLLGLAVSHGFHDAADWLRARVQGLQGLAPREVPEGFELVRKSELEELRRYKRTYLFRNGPEGPG